METKLFNLFQNKKNDYDLFRSVEKLIEETIQQAIGEENAKFYEALTKLSNSINNTQDKNSKTLQLKIINDYSHEICDEYEKFLP